MAKKKEEIWWCYKWDYNGELLAETANYSKQRLKDRVGYMKDAKPVRIAVREVKK